MMCFAFVACDNKDNSSPIPVAELKTAVVSHQQETTFRTSEENLTAKLVAVADSRCPSNAVCITAGSANVTFNVSEGTNETDVSVIFSGDGKNSGSQEFKLGGQTFNMTVTEVLPYPKTSTAPALEDYRISVSIERK